MDAIVWLLNAGVPNPENTPNMQERSSSCQGLPKDDANA
jgi:hypothetical protein